MQHVIQKLYFSALACVWLGGCDAGQEAPTDSGAPPAVVPSGEGGNGTGGASAVSAVAAGSSSDAGADANRADASSPSTSTPDANGVPVTPISPSDGGVVAPAADSGTSDTGVGAPVATLPKFSFFVASLSAMRTLSKNQNGFGGDLRFGEQGEGAGLRGADKICAAAAELSLPGAGAKQWRAFLSTTTVHARSRIGNGPWYDRKARFIAQDLASLLQDRPGGAEAIIRDDLPNELGEPNQSGSAEGGNDDNHDTVTASNASGEYDGSNTCADWTSTTAMGEVDPIGELIGISTSGPTVGHSWPAFSGTNWIEAHRAPGCSPSVALVQTGPGSGAGIGNAGGYGGIYCFALTP